MARRARKQVLIAAILRAQFLSMRPRARTRRGGTVVSALTGLIFYGFWTFLAWGAAVFLADQHNSSRLIPILSGGLLFVLLYWQLSPLISASFGASLDLRKLLAYPIPPQKLFTVEVLLRITSCGEMLIIMAGTVAGLMRNPDFGGRYDIAIGIGALTFVVTNILLSAGIRSMLERLFASKRLREAMLLLVVLISLAPRILFYARARPAALIRFVPSQPFWPWAAAARMMLHDRMGLTGSLAVIYCAAAYWFSRWQFERTLRFDKAAAAAGRLPASRSAGIANSLFRLPGRIAPDPMGAMIEKELRTLARIPRFRVVYALSCFFGLLLLFPAWRRLRPESFMTRNALPFMALYGLLTLGQTSYWNAFGFDRSSVQGYFSWPVRFRDVLVAKNIAVLFLMLPQIVFISLIARALSIRVTPGKMLEATLVMLIASLYWFAAGNIFSVRMPRAMDPEKMNQMSNKLQALTIWTAPLILLPIGLAYWARVVFESEALFAALLLLAAVIGWVVYAIGLESATKTADRRREAIILELSKSQGPVSLN